MVRWDGYAALYRPPSDIDPRRKLGVICLNSRPSNLPTFFVLLEAMFGVRVELGLLHSMFQTKYNQIEATQSRYSQNINLLNRTLFLKLQGVARIWILLDSRRSLVMPKDEELRRN
jgi:hypothetical protein